MFCVYILTSLLCPTSHVLWPVRPLRYGCMFLFFCLNFFFFFQAEDGIRDHCVTGVQTCALPISNFTPAAFYDMLGFGPGTRSFGSPFVADTVQPTLNIDSSAGAGETFVDTVDGPDLNNGPLCGFAGGGMNQACSGVVVWTMSNPTAHDSGGPAPTLTGSYVATNPFLLSPPQTQPSCATCVD